MEKIKKWFVITSLIVYGFSLPAEALGQVLHKNGELINYQGTIYLIENGKRRGFRTPGEFFSHGYTFHMALAATPEDQALPLGEIMKARDGSLVQDLRTNAHYLIYDEKAHLLFTPLVYSLGFEEVIPFQIDLLDYHLGPAFDAYFNYEIRPSGTLVRDEQTFYLIASAKKRPFPSWEVFLSYGYDEEMVLVANSKELSLPTGDVMQCRDGTLVNDQGTVYLITQGKKYGFKTWNGFLSLGYNPKTLISGSTKDYVMAGVFE